MNKKKKILIIDDEAYIRRVIELKMKKNGYDVYSACDGEEGLRFFMKYRPDIVITDFKMPKIDGREFCELTNVFKKERSFLTIVISCNMMENDFGWIDHLEETTYFEKPFSPSKLQDCIDAYFEKSLDL